MIKRSHVLAAFLWLSSFFMANAQVGFNLPTFTGVNPGTVLDMPMRVVNFDTVISVQFVIQWDPAVLKFVGLSQPTNPLSIVDSICFNFNEAQEGIIRFRWYSPGAPRTLADSVDIFHIQMRAIGGNGTATPVAITELPPQTVFEVARMPGPQFYNLSTALITSGAVSIGTVSSTEATGAAAQIRIEATPNPFTEQINLTFDLPSGGETQCTITDVNGKICYQEKKYLEQGRTGTVIANGVFPARGLYFVHIANGAFHAVQPIVYQ
jgi:hypothetical protein